MDITTVTTYKLNGKEFKSLAAIKTHLENSIGAIIDYSDVTLTPKQKLNLLAAIIKNKKELVYLLSVRFNEKENGLQSDWRNIFDIP
jgi:hypothetical protein